MTAEYAPKLVHLPGTKLTPEVVLHRTLNKMDHIKAVTIIVQWKDDTFAVDWSQQQVSEFNMAATAMTLQAHDLIQRNNIAETDNGEII